MKILGILNITSDSFSDGGKYLDPAAALLHADRLLAEGADILDVGAASSHPDAAPVPPDVEITRLEAVVEPLHNTGASLSIDTFSTPVQRWALAQGVDYLNDIHGFADSALYPDLAASRTKLIVMHAVQEQGLATRIDVPPGQIMERITRFFDARLNALAAAGIAADRMILDPGMGFFLGTNPETSLTVLGHLPELADRYGLPVLVSVSRKSFLKALAGPETSADMSAAVEMFAVRQGADMIRTHAPAPLVEALKVLEELQENEAPPAP
ncbi:MAG: dihydropteroate synthase [Alphaproteobacteria bacterium]|nr:dihydropteroate synthase [Alphaproteobacteria bacterium]